MLINICQCIREIIMNDYIDKITFYSSNNKILTISNLSKKLYCNKLSDDNNTKNKHHISYYAMIYDYLDSSIRNIKFHILANTTTYNRKDQSRYRLWMDFFGDERYYLKEKDKISNY